MIMYSLILNSINFLNTASADGKEGLGPLALIIAFACFLIPVITLSIIVVIKKIIRIFKKSKKTVKSNTSLSKDAFLGLFGEDNVVSVDTVMTRVIVEVKDVDLVNIEELKKLNVGILITGNVIKCSSEEYANLFK